VAPTKVWPNWEGASPSAAQSYRIHLHSLGFDIPALQRYCSADPRRTFLIATVSLRSFSHLTHVAELAGELVCTCRGFGCSAPKDRGSLTMQEALDRAAEVLYGLAGAFAARGTWLVYRAQSPPVRCNFVVNAKRVPNCETCESSRIRPSP